MHRPTNSPIACRMTAETQRARQAELDAGIFSLSDESHVLPDGRAFRFPGSGDVIERLVRFLRVERECCPFFTFELLFEPDEGPVWLHMRGPAGTREFIEATISGCDS